MQRFIFTALSACCLASAVLSATGWSQEKSAQEKAAEQAALDKLEKQRAAEAEEISAKTTQLEAELGKYKDTSPEAADAMVKLADLYHAHARVFGLVRVARRFTAAHSTDERHKAMMIKLIDALEATSRQADMVTACRQFIGHYPDAEETAEVEDRLTAVLDRMNKPAEAAQAYEQAWKRRPTPQNFRNGSAAVRRFQAINTPESRIEAAKLAEEVLDKAPNGPFAEEMAWIGLNAWRSVSDWGKTNLLASKMLKRNLPAGKAALWQLYRLMGENYGNLAQQANSAEGYKRARDIKDDASLAYNQVLRLFYANVKADVLAPVVAGMLQKFPEAPERFAAQSYLAQTYIRDAEVPKGIALIKTLLPFDAATNNQASLLVLQIGAEPANFADAERTLLDAILKNKAQGAYLRYVLAFDLYRDRIKDLAKTRQTLRDLLT